MKKETAFALRTGKTFPGSEAEHLHQSIYIAKVKITVLSFLSLELVKEQLFNLNTPLKNFKVLPLGKEAWFEDPTYDRSPEEYEIIFLESFCGPIAQDILLNFTCQLPESILIKSLDIQRKNKE